MKEIILYTIGHSTRDLEEFLQLLKIYEIRTLIDVRTIPKSRRMPWFNGDALASTLKKVGIPYQSMKSLGGLRHPLKNSINMGWHNESFRGFADYMQTAAFAEAIDELYEMMEKTERLAIMCAEAVPWRCHRSLIADAFLARGISTMHIVSHTSLIQHHLTSFAVLDKRVSPPRVYYPSDENSSR